MERRLGKIQARHSQVNDLFEVALRDTPEGVRLFWEIKKERKTWRDLREGAYMLRTNLQAESAQDLWSKYMQLTEAEASFRALKSELSIRPLFHQKESRVKAHVLVAFLGYALWITLKHLLKRRPAIVPQPSLSGVISRHFQWMLLLQEIKYLELLELRQILEPAAAALAARRATKDDIEKMQEALAGMRSGFHNPERFMVNEIAFHECILQAAKNVAIQTTMRMMYDAMAEGRRRVLPLVDDLKRNFDRHERIFNFIQKRDAQGARQEILEDLRYAEALLRRDLDAQDKFRKEAEHTPKQLKQARVTRRGKPRR